MESTVATKILLTKMTKIMEIIIIVIIKTKIKINTKIKPIS